MAFISINPNYLSEATKDICCEVLGLDEYAQRLGQDYFDGELTPSMVAAAFNTIDPEVTGLSSALEEKWRKEESH